MRHKGYLRRLHEFLLNSPVNRIRVEAPARVERRVPVPAPDNVAVGRAPLILIENILPSLPQYTLLQEASGPRLAWVGSEMRVYFRLVFITHTAALLPPYAHAHAHACTRTRARARCTGLHARTHTCARACTQTRTRTQWTTNCTTNTSNM